jgi:hypothetical protein
MNLARLLMSALTAVATLALSAAVALWHGGSRAANDAPLPAISVERQGDTWVLKAHAAPRLLLARRLAEVTGSELLDQPELLAQAGAVTLQWRGADLAEVWARVLADDVAYALQCRDGRCRVWINGVAPGLSASAARR